MRAAFGFRYLVQVARVLAVLWTVVGLPAMAQGPVGVGAHVVTAYTDNLFRSYSERSDWVQQVYLDFDYGGPGLAAYYSVEASLFAEYEDLFTQTHAIGVTASKPGPDRRLVTGDLSLAMRAGRPDYRYKDYTEASGYLRAKRYLGPSLLLRGGTGLRVREYGHAGDFSYAEPTAYAQVSRFLPTRTTLVAGLDLGLKVYLRAAGDPTADNAATYARTSDGDAQAQATAWLKVAQSLATRTGLQLQYTHLDLVAGGTRYRRTEDYDPTEELFDDGYSRSEHELRATLKHRDAAGFDLMATARRARRHYEGRPALGLDGLPVGWDQDRQDTRTALLVRVDRDLTASAPAPVAALALRLEWSLLTVDSNDPYYDASTRVYSAALRLGL